MTLNETNKNETNNSKNVQIASKPGGQTHRNTKLIKSLNLCSANQNTIRIQSAVKDAIRYRSDPSGKVITLSKYSFSKATHKLLNKNLNFVPAPKNTTKMN